MNDAVETPEGTLRFDPTSESWTLQATDRPSRKVSAARALRLLTLLGLALPGAALATTMGGGYGGAAPS